MSKTIVSNYKVVATYYDQQFERYRRFSDSSFSWRFIERPELRRLLRPFIRRRMQILDIGVGNGRIVKFLTTLGIKPENIFGVDVSLNMLNEAKRRVPAATFLHGDIALVRLPRAKFDLAVSVMVMHYLDSKRIRKAMQNVFRSLKPGGRIVMIEPHPVRAYVGYSFADYLTSGWRKVKTPWNTWTPLFHHPMHDYVMAMLESGFHIDIFHEPAISPAGKNDARRYRIYSKYPGRIAIVARKPAMTLSR